MRTKVIFALVFLGLVFFPGCNNKQPSIKSELLFYCGITMVEPVQEIADIIEKQENCKITVLLDGSQNLLDIIDVNKVGDLYLPGAMSYLNSALRREHILDIEVVGNITPVLIVAKNNPKKILPELKSLTDPELRVVLGSSESSSIGVKTIEILKSVDIYDDVMKNILYIATDSNNINRVIIDGDADIGINWKAAVSCEANSKYIDYFSLKGEFVLSEEIGLGILKYSLFPEIAGSFLDYAVSEKGQEIFRHYGF